MIIGIITGATGVGKTNCVLKLAQELNAEIINADSRQVYQDVAIGVASPTQDEYQLIKHHLFDFVPLCQKYSVGQFYREVKELVELNPNKKFIVVGGTGFYIKALIDGLSEIPLISSKTKELIMEKYSSEGLPSLYQELGLIDPKSHQRISVHDTNRILRAIEVYYETGKPWSYYQNVKSLPLFKGKISVLSRPREILYDRINRRVVKMVNSGWLNEIDGIIQKGFSFEEPGLNALGYRELHRCQYLNDSTTEAIETIQKKTRNYAKRQLTYMRGQFDRKQEFNLELEGVFTDILNFFKENKLF